jgi:hypothetical protein
MPHVAEWDDSEDHRVPASVYRKAFEVRRRRRRQRRQRQRQQWLTGGGVGGVVAGRHGRAVSDGVSAQGISDCGRSEARGVGCLPFVHSGRRGVASGLGWRDGGAVSRPERGPAADPTLWLGGDEAASDSGVPVRRQDDLSGDHGAVRGVRCGESAHRGQEDARRQVLHCQRREEVDYQRHLCRLLYGGRAHRRRGT